MIWLIPHIILVVFNLVNAIHDARRIKKNKPIKHWLNLLLYLIVTAPLGYFFSWLIVPAALFCRFTIFNPSLSLFRGLKWDYVSPEREARADKVLYRLFGHNGKAPVIISGALWIATIVTDYIIHLLQFSK